LFLIAEPILTYDGNYALSFDGINDFVRISHESTDSQLDSWTIEAWVTVNSKQLQKEAITLVGIPRQQPILGYCGSENPNCTEGQVTIQIRNSEGKLITCTSRKTINDMRWHHVAATWDGETLIIYVNGKNPSTLSVPNFVPRKCDDCLEGFQLGGFNVGNLVGNFFNGLIDEVRIWKSVRTASQIKETSNRTITSEAGLLYYWRLDESQGTLVSSSSAVAYGTLGGGISSAEPKWEKSTAPLTNIDVVLKSKHPLAPSMITGLFIASSSFLLGIILGILFVIFGRKITNYTSYAGDYDSAIAKDAWESESLILEEND